MSALIQKQTKCCGVANVRFVPIASFAAAQNMAGYFTITNAPPYGTPVSSGGAVHSIKSRHQKRLEAEPLIHRNSASDVKLLML
jgi:hypothetical protein